MTELFDGDGAPEQMQAARAHLKSCAPCERVWRDWNRTRFLLRAAPAPLAPPLLAERVLLSCRLQPSQDAAAQSALENEIAREELARYINAPDAEYSALLAAPLAGFFEAAVLPADLKLQILQSTVQDQNVRAKASVFSALSILSIGPSIAETARAWSRSASMPRTGRWGFALAVPAMAAWILMIAPPSNLEITAPSTPQRSTFTTSIFPKNLLPKLPQKLTISKPAPKPETRVVAKPLSEPNFVANAVSSSLLKNENRSLSSPNMSFASRFVGFSTPDSPPQSSFATPLKPSVEIKKSKDIALQNKPSTPARTAVSFQKRRKPLINMARAARTRVLPVSFSSRASVLAQSLLKRLPSDSEREVSTLQNVEPRNTAPTLIASVDFDETLRSVGRLRDDRPEELGHAFDNYRASLMEQNADEAPSDEILVDQL